MKIPSGFLPPDSKPHERAILLLYYGWNMTDPKDIAETLYGDRENDSSVYRTLKKYKEQMSGKRVVYRQRYAGKSLSGPLSMTPCLVITPPSPITAEPVESEAPQSL